MNKPIVIVMVAGGKGRSEGADWIKPVLFSTVSEAEKYIEKVTDLESKYWTYAEIVQDNQAIEPYYGEFL